MKIKENWLKNSLVDKDKYLSMYKDLLKIMKGFGIIRRIELVGQKNILR